MTSLHVVTPLVEPVCAPIEAPPTVLTTFLSVDEQTTDLMIHLALRTGQPLVGIYEQLRLGIAQVASQPDADSLVEAELDDSLVRLVARLRPATRSRPIWQACILSAASRGVSACTSHLLAEAGIPSMVITPTQGDRSAVSGGRAFSQLLRTIDFVIIDGSRASADAIARCLRLANDGQSTGRRARVILLTDPGRSVDVSLRSTTTGITVVGHLGQLLSTLGIAAANPLTARERQVLTHVASGATNEQIARRLGVAVSTIKTYLERTHVKLKSRDRASAVATAMLRNWL